MTFAAVEKALREGKKIKLPKWKNAYWYMKDGVLMNHFEDAPVEKDVPTTRLFPHDLLWVLRDDWEIVEDDEQTSNLTATLVPVPDFSFSVALDYLKQGKKVARKGWNGKGMFLVLCPGSAVPADRMKVKAVKKFYQDVKQDTVIINPHIDMKAVDGTYVTGWLASQTDMLADDWNIVE